MFSGLYDLFSRILPTVPMLRDKSISHGYHDIQLCPKAFIYYIVSHI